MNLIELLEKRGFIDQKSSPEIDELVKKPISLYVGFDPTADSLHLGNLMGIMALLWFQKYGHTPCVLLGGATARIGDPSGKSHERPLLLEEEIQHNLSAIKRFFIALFARFEGNSPIILNNSAWFSQMSFVDFLRDVGKQFRMGSMLAKESVKQRLSSNEGMSFTEFSYQVLQGYDFCHLFTEHNVVLQMGGSDQWGNITAGIEFTRKKIQKGVYGLTFPLLTNAEGKKFGKTEKGAIWLDEKKLSPYEFYQYLFCIPDQDVIKLLRLLTFLPLEEITSLSKEMNSSSYLPNTAQKKLAEEVTLIVHGKKGLQTALKVTESVKPGKKTILSKQVLEELGKDIPHKTLEKKEVLGKKIVDIAVIIGLVSSKGEMNRLIKNNGAYLNNERIEMNFSIETKHAIEGTYLLFGVGKKKRILVTLT